MVENAVHHGIKENGGEGTVRIMAWRDEKELIFMVTDDGCGMDEERITEVLEGRAKTGKSGFGIFSLIRKGFDWEKNGFDNISEASSAAEALEFIEHRRPQLVLTDISMPRMDGLELSTEILKKMPECRIVIVTGYREEAVHKLTAYNCQDMISECVCINIMPEGEECKKITELIQIPGEENVYEEIRHMSSERSGTISERNNPQDHRFP